MERQTVAGHDLQLNTNASGGGSVTVTNDGTFATPAKQDTGNTSLASIDSKIPASPATSAKQDTGNTALASIATSVANIPVSPSTTGKQDTGNASLANIDTVQGAKADAAWSSGDGTVIAILKKISSNTGSSPAITNDGTFATPARQDTTNTEIGATNETAPSSDTATSGLNGRLQRIAQRITSLIAAIGSPFQAGGSIGNTDFPVADGSNAVLGITTGAAVTTDVSSTIQRYIRGIIKFFTLDGWHTPVANDWAVHHVPATNVKATITQASAGSGNRNICHGITATIATDATAPTSGTPLIVSLIDGASGGPTYLWRSYIIIPALAATQLTIVKSFPKPIKGSQATAMTLEFSAAGGADTYESVSMNGSSITE